MINIGSIVRIKYKPDVMRHGMETPHGIVINVVTSFLGQEEFRLYVIKYLDTGEVSSYFGSHLEEL